MFLIKVIPLEKNIPGQNFLTYFSKEEISIGFLVEIIIKNSKSFGLVISCEDLLKNKMLIKKTDFNLKKIKKVWNFKPFTSQFMSAISEISQYFLTSQGAIISSITPKAVLKNLDKVRFDENRSGSYSETLALQAPAEERYAIYKSLIREEFARNKSIFLCAPNIEEIRTAKEKLTKGIEEYSFVFDGSMNEKELVLNFKKILNEKHPTLVIATPIYISLLKSDLGTFILEKENSKSYHSIKRPYIDFRRVVEILARKINIKLILADNPLRIETIHRVKIDEYKELSPLKFRMSSLSDTSLVSSPKSGSQNGGFKALGKEILSLIESNIKEGDNIFIYCNRKGLNPITVCSDCGDLVLCSNCMAPVVLYSNTKNKNQGDFYCPKCTLKRDALETCKRCGSWRLTPLGIGAELVKKEIEENFKDANIFLINRDHIKTEKQLISAVEKFYKTPGSIILGTELALPYLKTKIANTAIASIDGLFAIPDFNINERIIRIIINLKEISYKNILIQTRHPNNKIFNYGLSGNILDFYKDEMLDRKEIGYPPFSLFIKVSLTADKTKVQNLLEKLKENLHDFDVSVFKSFYSFNDRNYIGNCLIKLKVTDWPNKDLAQKLMNLPRIFDIRVEPDNLL